MHALSMMQPYAWLFSRGLLTIDDRSRATALRGPVAIHASKRFHAAYYDFLRAKTDWPLPEVQDFEHGGIVGVANLVDCLPAVRKGEEFTPDIRRAHFGMPGFFGLVFEQPRVLAMIPCRGNVGFFQVQDLQNVRETAALSANAHPPGDRLRSTRKRSTLP